MSDVHDTSWLHDASEHGLHFHPDAPLCHTPTPVCSTLEPCIHICANNSTILEQCAILLVDFEGHTHSVYRATTLWSPTYIAVTQYLNEGLSPTGFKGFPSWDGNSQHQIQVDMFSSEFGTVWDCFCLGKCTPIFWFVMLFLVIFSKL